MGPSGCGKSTLFNQIGALDVPTEGKVYFENESVFDLTESQQAWFRCNKIGYIFQTFNLVPVMSALQNVTLPMVFQGTSKEEAAARGKVILERVGPGAPARPQTLGAFRRSAAARRHRPLAGQPSGGHPRGRTDRQSRHPKPAPPWSSCSRELNTQDGAHRDLFHARSQDDLLVPAASAWMLDGNLDKITSGEDFRLGQMEQDRQIQSRMNPPRVDL